MIIGVICYACFCYKQELKWLFQFNIYTVININRKNFDPKLRGQKLQAKVLILCRPTAKENVNIPCIIFMLLH